jgi:hypothetical protein
LLFPKNKSSDHFDSHLNRRNRQYTDPRWVIATRARHATTPLRLHPAFMCEWRLFMTKESTPKSYPVEEAVRAQKALRTAAGLGPEMFPLQAFE